MGLMRELLNGRSWRFRGDAGNYRYGYPAFGKPEPDVAAQWLFEETSGPIVDQVSGITLTPDGVPTYGVTASGKHRFLSPGIGTSGATGFGKTTDTPSCAVGTGDFTVEAWFRSPPENIFFYPLLIGDVENGNYWSVQVDQTSFDLFFFNEFDLLAGAEFPMGMLQDGNMQKIRIAVNRGGTARGYANKTLIDAIDVSAAAAYNYSGANILAGFAGNPGCEFFELRLSLNATNNSTP